MTNSNTAKAVTRIDITTGEIPWYIKKNFKDRSPDKSYQRHFQVSHKVPQKDAEGIIIGPPCLNIWDVKASYGILSESHKIQLGIEIQQLIKMNHKDKAISIGSVPYIGFVELNPCDNFMVQTLKIWHDNMNKEQNSISKTTNKILMRTLEVGTELTIRRFYLEKEDESGKLTGQFKSKTITVHDKFKFPPSILTYVRRELVSKIVASTLPKVEETKKEEGESIVASIPEEAIATN